jgi:hypothetical protein
VLKQYKDRYQDFEKGVKQSRKTIQQNEKDIAALGRSVKQLEEQKRKALL